MRQQITTCILSLGIALSIHIESLGQTQDELKRRAVTLVNAGEYKHALSLFGKLDANTIRDAEVQLNLGICYLHSTHQAAKAKEYIEAAIRLGVASQHPEAYYYQGNLLQLEHSFIKAINAYERYKDNASPAKLPVEERIGQCDAALKMPNDAKQTVSPIDALINTSYDDFAPVVSFDKRECYFSSNRPLPPAQLIIDQDDQQPFMDSQDRQARIYQATSGYLSSQQNLPQWEVAPDPPSVFGSGITVPLSMSSDKKKLLIYRKENQEEGLFILEKDKESWSRPKKVSRYLEGNEPIKGACFAEGGSTIYISLKKEGGIGGYDIYRSTETRTGNWSKPQALGADINTTADEMYPYMHPDNVTLYLSSNRKGSIGGMDIFETKLQNGTWTKPENVGFPINSAYDEFQLVKQGNGDIYFTSNRQSEKSVGGIDIYAIHRNPSQNPLALVQGHITCHNGNNKLPVRLSVHQLPGQQTQHYVMQPHPRDGYFFFVAPPGFNYQISLTIPTLRPISFEVNIHDSIYLYHFEQQIQVQDITLMGRKIGIKPAIEWDLKSLTIKEDTSGKDIRYAPLVQLTEHLIMTGDSIGFQNLDNFTQSTYPKDENYYDRLIKRVQKIVENEMVELFDSIGQPSLTSKGTEGYYEGQKDPLDSKQKVLLNYPVQFLSHTSTNPVSKTDSELAPLIKLVQQDQTLKIRIERGKGPLSQQRAETIQRLLLGENLRNQASSQYGHFTIMTEPTDDLGEGQVSIKLIAVPNQ